MSAALQLGVLAVARSDIGAAANWGRSAITAVVYLVVASAVAFLLWFDAISVVGPERAALTAGAIPIAALASGVALGVATFDTVAVIGTGIVVVGATFGLRSRHRNLVSAVA